MRLNENVYLTTYFNSFDSNMAYALRDKDPKTLRYLTRLQLILRII